MSGLRSWRRAAGALAILALGAAALLAAAPAYAQTTVWSATLTVDFSSTRSGGIAAYGCDNVDKTATNGAAGKVDNCSSSTVLSEDEFSHAGTDYDVETVVVEGSSGTVSFHFGLVGVTSANAKSGLAGMTLKVVKGSAEATFDIDDALAATDDNRLAWTTMASAMSWRNNDSVTLTLTASAAKPKKPAGFTATAGNARVLLAWSNPGDSTITKWQYRQKIGSAAWGSWTDIPSSGATTTSYTVTGLANGTEHRFRIRAVNSAGDGTPSDVARATPTAGASFVAPPANAVWFATLTVDYSSANDEFYYGCANSNQLREGTAVGNIDACSTSTVLTDDDFSYGSPSATYTVIDLTEQQNDDVLYLRFSGLTGAQAKTALTGLTLNLGSSSFAIADATADSNWLKWGSVRMNWSSGDTVSASLTAAAATMTDNTPPTVTATQTGYYSDSGLSNALTGPLNGGTDIYTKVTFSEDMKHTKNDSASARPEIFHRIGSNDTQYDILDNGDTLATGDCKPNHASNTNVYVCRYTVGTSVNGAFTVKVGTNSVDKANNALAAVYTHATTLTLDTTAPSAPSGLALASGTTSPGSDDTPSIEVTVGETGGAVTLYSDSGCATAASAATDVTDTSSPYKVTATATALSTDGSVTFYAKHADAATNASACSTANVAYTYDGTAPTVTGVAVGSMVPAGQGGFYKKDDEIKVDVTFSEIIEVTESPELKIRVGSGAGSEKTATCAKKGTTGDDRKKLECTYTVASGDADMDGISVEANKLSLPAGAAIEDAADNAATLTHNALAAQSGHKVDGVTPAKPSMLSMSSPSTTDGNDKTPSIEVTVGETGGTVTLYETFRSPCDTTLSAAVAVTDTTAPYTVVVTANDVSRDGQLRYNSRGLGFRAKHTNARGNASECSSANVFYTYDGVDPSITFPSGKTPTTGVGATIALADANSKVKKYGAIPVVGTATNADACDTASEVGTDNLTTLDTPAASVSFAYTPPADSATKKVCAYVEDAAGNTAASLWATAIAQGVPKKPANFQAAAGDTQVVLTWDDPGDSTISKYQYRQKAGTAAYGAWTDVTGSGSSTVTHTFTSLSNGTEYKYKIRAVNSAGNSAESDEVSATPASGDTTGPTVSSIAITSSAPTHVEGYAAVYRIGDALEVTVTFNEALVLTGSPVLKIKVGTAEKDATCAKGGTSGDAAKTLVCSYAVVEGDEDTDGIAVEAGKLTGTIKDGSNNAATLTYTAIADSSGHKVDGVKPTITGFSSIHSAGWYRQGQQMEFQVEFSEDVVLTGVTRLAVKVGANTRQFERNSASPPGGEVGNKPKHNYDVQAGEQDADGISIDAGSLTLVSGATVTDTAGNAATLTHSAWPAQSDYKVDGVKPAVTFPSAAPRLESASRITLTDAASKVAKYGIVEVAGTAMDATGCDDPSSSGDNFSTTAVSPAASPKRVDYTPAAATSLGKKLCVYVEDTAGNSHAQLWSKAIVAADAPLATGVPVDAIWSGRLKVSVFNGWRFGCDNRPNVNGMCSKRRNLRDDDVTHGGVTRQVESLVWLKHVNELRLSFVGTTGDEAKAAFAGTTLSVEGREFAFDDAEPVPLPGSGTLVWAADLGWTKGQAVQVWIAPSPSGRPARPSGFVATPGRGEVVLTWDDPGDAGIVKYQYQHRVLYNGGEDSGWSAWTDIPDSGADTTRHTVTGLGTRVTYEDEFRIRAVNADGAGPASEPSRCPPAPDPTAPAEIWSATLTVDQGSAYGCNNSGWPHSHDPCTSSLTEDEFTHAGTTYTVETIVHTSGGVGDLYLRFKDGTPAAAKTALAGLTLTVGSGADAKNLAIDAATVVTDNSVAFLRWPAGLSWGEGDRVSLTLATGGGTPPAPAPTVDWSATLTVAYSTDFDNSVPTRVFYGCLTSRRGTNTGIAACTSTQRLSDNTFTYAGTDYTVNGVYLYDADGSTPYLHFDLAGVTPSAAKAALSGLTLTVGTGASAQDFAFSAAEVVTETPRNISVLRWKPSPALGWNTGDAVALKLTAGGGAPPAPAPTPAGDWSATLTVDYASNAAGCGRSVSGSNMDSCSTATVLTDDDFEHKGTTYTIAKFYRYDANLGDGYGPLHLELSGVTGAAAKTALAGVTLAVVHGGNTSTFAVADASTSGGYMQWSYSGAVWGEGDTVELSLTGLAASSTTTPSAADWSPTLTVDRDDTVYGCDNGDTDRANCSATTVLTEDAFTYGGATYTVRFLTWSSLYNLLAVEFDGLTADAAKTGLAGLTLNVGSSSYAFNDATASGNRLSWTASLGWTHGQSVALSLTVPAGQQAPTGPAPKVELAWVTDAVLALRFDAPLDGSSVPAASAFAVSVAGDARDVSEVAVDRDTVTLTLASAVSAGETVTVDYTPPSENPLRGGGADVAAFTGQAVENATVSTLAAPEAPSGLTATASGPGTVSLSWTAPAAATGRADVTGYEVRHATGNGAFGAWTATGSTDTGHDVDGLAAETEYRFEVRATSAAGPSAASNAASATTEAAPPPLTASVSEAPAEHDGVVFAVQIAFSEEVETAASEASFDVSGGAVSRARRIGGRKDLWRINVKPSGHASVTLTLAAGAASTADGRTLSEAVTATVAGPPGLSVADARVDEAPGARVSFAVTLDRAATRGVRVSYATADGSATAGADYRAKSGKLLFRPGQTSKTVTVRILDDSVDEGEETFTLVLSEPTGAYLADAEATATIVNSDPMPKAWLARFGRAATDHVVDALEARFEDRGYDTAREARFGGMNLLGGGVFGPDSSDPSAPESTGYMGSWARNERGTGYAGLPARGGRRTGSMASPGFAGADTFGAASGFRGASGHGGVDALRNMLRGSSFRAAWGDAEGGRLTAWGNAASTFFGGEDDGVAVDGDATTVMLGADAAWSRWLAGVALARTTGSGSYRGETDLGTLSSTLTAVHPYARFEATERLSAWATLGLGAGDLDLVTGAGAAWHAPTSMGMAAAGLRGVLLQGRGGLELAGRLDGRFTRMASEAVFAGAGNLAAATGDASRARLMLEGARPFAVGANRTLTPMVEIGLRHDGGDAETGAGVELGGSLRYLDAALGLSVDLSGRRLAAHAHGAYEEWGAAAMVRLDPGTSGRGLTLTLAPAWGAQASGGAERLWSMTDARGLQGYAPDSGMRLMGDVAYGMDAFGGKGAVAPYAGAAMTGYGRDWRAGVRWTLGASTEFGFEATRTESGAEPATHGLQLRFSWRPGIGFGPPLGDVTGGEVVGADEACGGRCARQRSREAGIGPLAVNGGR